MLTLPYVGPNNGDSRRASPVVVVGADGELLDTGSKKAYALVTNGALTNATGVSGGDYLWANEATAWNSATATLQYLGQDGTTWRNVRNAANTADVTMTANGQVGIGIGQGSTLRVSLSGGPPSALYSNLAGL